jgi:hypothetical protein
MRKLWKGVLLGAAAGGAVKAWQEVQGDGTIDEVGPAVAKAAGQAAAAGAVVGFVLDRRSRRKLSRLEKAKAKAGLGGVVAGAGALAEVALPAIQAAAEVARKKGVEAAVTAKPHVEHAAAVAKKKGLEATEAAKPHVSHATDLAKARAQKAGTAAKAKLAEYDLPVVVAV